MGIGEGGRGKLLSTYIALRRQGMGGLSELLPGTMTALEGVRPVRLALPLPPFTFFVLSLFFLAGSCVFITWQVAVEYQQTYILALSPSARPSLSASFLFLCVWG